jgi:hypothetical protein
MKTWSDCCDIELRDQAEEWLSRDKNPALTGFVGCKIT